MSNVDYNPQHDQGEVSYRFTIGPCPKIGRRLPDRDSRFPGLQVGRRDERESHQLGIGVRVVTFGRSPFCYPVRGDGIVIERIVHGARSLRNVFR